MSDVLASLRLAARNLRRRPGSTLVICLSLALALAGNALIFSLFEAMILRPFPYPDSDRLAFVWSWDRSQPGPEGQSGISPADFLDLRERTRGFHQLEAVEAGLFNLTGGDRPEQIQGVVATPGFLSLFSVQPTLGRTFVETEGAPGNQRVALLAPDLWRRRFGGREDIVGQTIQLDEETYTVVGVLPDTFEFFLTQAQVYVPLALERASAPRNRRSLIVMGRLADGTTLESAGAEMATLGRALESEHPDANRGYDNRVIGLRDNFPGETDRKLFTYLQGTMLLVLLIACLNVANILLVRGQERQKEIALRTSLGGTRTAMIRQLLAESLLLSLGGGLLGVALAGVGISILIKALATQLPKMITPALNAPVLGFSFALMLAAGVLVGLLPALQTTRPQLARTLNDTSRGTTMGGKRRRTAQALVVTQVAFALMLLCGTGLLVRALTQLRTIDPGFRDENLVVFTLNLPERRYAGGVEVDGFYRQLIESLEALPGVTAATATPHLPRGQNFPSTPIAIDGREVAADQAAPEAGWLKVPAGYFEALGIPLLAGRSLATADTAASGAVVVVGKAFAERHFPGENPLGRRITVAGVSREIVGIVGDVLQTRMVQGEGRPPMVYAPLAQVPERGLAVVVRTDRAVEGGLGDALRGAVGKLDPNLPVADMMTYDAFVAQQFNGARIIAAIVGWFSLVGLVLAALGIYGLVSYTVTQRTQEFGIRMAVGAARGDILGQTVRQGALLSGIGLALGIPGAIVSTRLVAAILGGLLPISGGTVPFIALLLALVTLVASVIPARRAASLDPVEALRRG